MRTHWFGVLWVVTGLSLAAQPFSQSLTPAERAEAGLTQLTPEQLARLDALVAKHQQGVVTSAVSTARAETKTAVRAEVEREVKAQAKPASPSLLARAKVIITPGTEIEYETIETELVGVFEGFEPGAVFKLANGQRWQVLSGTYAVGPTPSVKRVWVEPGVLGAFFLRFDGIAARPKVKLLGQTK